MNIRSGMTDEEYAQIGQELAFLKSKELLKVFEALRSGHDARRQQEGSEQFVGPDHFLGVVMDRLAECVNRKNVTLPTASEQQMNA